MSSDRPRFYKLVTAIYRDVLVNKYKDQHFWILGAFIPTFIVARLLVRVDPRIFLKSAATMFITSPMGF
jgi:hypothetical protein